ncbi:unnamed protein product [Acanthosepion pharaonis]|uniref:Uncharacterized protein n=1 Tax=Acanthosepion pharaonis TaxID=158019 RepID=A0A812D6W0_ACAPH|nr:unnamed protein product [Sepia pharaonis]
MWVELSHCDINFIRAQDKVLLSQLQQCQDNIERLKRQRQQAAEQQHELQSLDDDSYWEDWEISEFDMEDKKNFGHQSLNSKRFAHSNPELSKSLLATYNGNCPSIKKDLEIQKENLRRSGGQELKKKERKKHKGLDDNFEGEKHELIRWRLDIKQTK